MEQVSYIISHVRECDNSIQTNKDHSLGVAQLTKHFADEFGMGDWGYFIGILHDKGKERYDFQNYIRCVNGIEASPYKDKTHAWIGAKLAQKLAPNLYPIASYPILGHHAGLCDYLSLDSMNKKVIPSEIDCDVKILSPSIEFFQNHDLLSPERQKYIHHVVRILFSCLVDADFLDTEKFMQPEKSELRSSSLTIQYLLPKLETYLSKFNVDTPINIIRREIQDCCRKKAEKPQGVYSLTVPTGGGKTLSSLLWAMLHAVKNGKHRVIIAIPYTSIISQTAKILKKIFGNEAVLEHHSDYDYHDDEERYGGFNQESLATENWDAPIIITTNVQLFESMYASYPGKCRKLHNIANSVIILDEAQTLPGEHLQAIVDALKAYNILFGVTVLFTTASQPTLEGKRKGHLQDLSGFDKIEELMPAKWRLHDRLRRVKLTFDERSVTYNELANRVMQYDKVLCIVNTRKVAAELYKSLPKSRYNYHLSRNMCPEHIDETLEEIKERLKLSDGCPIRVVTTQLIEAGVDIDFPVVMRQEIGLDSILQAAGRCNREGKLNELGNTIVFRIDGVNIPAGMMSYANQARKNMCQNDDLFSPEAMSEYFIQYYNLIPTFDIKKLEIGNENIDSLLHNIRELQFDTASKYFRLIDDNGYTIVINYKESAKLISQMRQGDICKKKYRQLGRYSVTVPKYIFDELKRSGMVEPVISNGKETGLFYVSDPKQYDNHYGFILNNQLFLNETLIF